MCITSGNSETNLTMIIVIAAVLINSSREIELFFAPGGFSQRTRVFNSMASSVTSGQWLPVYCLMTMKNLMSINNCPFKMIFIARRKQNGNSRENLLQCKRILWERAFRYLKADQKY